MPPGQLVFTEEEEERREIRESIVKPDNEDNSAQ